MAGALQTDEFRNVFQILAKYKLLAFGHYRNIAYSKFEQPLSALRIVEHIDRNEVNAFFRKKLFRSEAAASPGLGEEYETVSDGIHRDSGMWIEKGQTLPDYSAG
jgi:hypothetical protein